MVPWQLCRLTSEDIQPVLEIEHLSFPRPWRQQSFVSELTCQQACSLVVRLESQGTENEIAGYMCLRFILNEMHILKIAVAPARRRQGIHMVAGKSVSTGNAAQFCIGADRSTAVK